MKHATKLLKAIQKKPTNHRLQTPVKSFFSQKKSKDIELPEDYKEEYEKSLFSKIAKIQRRASSSDLSNTLKFLYIFKEYTFPRRSKDPYFFQILMRSYKYLFLSKTCNSLMPLCMKAGINMVSSPDFALSRAYSIFMGYVFVHLFGSYCDGYRILNNGQVTQQAITKISIRAYKQMLRLDWEMQLEGMKVQIFNLERVRRSIERNMNMLNGIMIPIMFEIAIASMMILWFCGPMYFMNLSIAIGFYLRFTIHNSRERKPFIMQQNLIDKKSHFTISGTPV